MIAVTIEGVSPELYCKSESKRYGKTLPTPFALIARMNFSLKNYSCELLNLTRTVGKVELISTFTTAVCESCNGVTNTPGLMLEILNNYSWTRLSVRIIGVIKVGDKSLIIHKSA